MKSQIGTTRKDEISNAVPSTIKRRPYRETWSFFI